MESGCNAFLNLNITLNNKLKFKTEQEVRTWKIMIKSFITYLSVSHFETFSVTYAIQKKNYPVQIFCLSNSSKNIEFC
jgi:hypothetical protein